MPAKPKKDTSQKSGEKKNKKAKQKIQRNLAFFGTYFGVILKTD